MLERGRIVVPLDVIAGDDADILRGVVPLDAGPAHLHIAHIADHHIHRHAVAPGIVHRHGGVLQPDGAVGAHAQRLALDLVVAVAHRDRNFLMRAGEEFRADIAAVVDERLMQAAEARGRVGGDVVESEAFQAVDHEVAAAAPFGEHLQRGRNRGLGRAVRRRDGRPRRGRLCLGGAIERHGESRGAGERRALEELAALDIRDVVVVGHGRSPCFQAFASGANWGDSTGFLGAKPSREMMPA